VQLAIVSEPRRASRPLRYQHFSKQADCCKHACRRLQMAAGCNNKPSAPSPTTMCSWSAVTAVSTSSSPQRFASRAHGRACSAVRLNVSSPSTASRAGRLRTREVRVRGVQAGGQLRSNLASFVRARPQRQSNNNKRQETKGTKQHCSLDSSARQAK